MAAGDLYGMQTFDQSLAQLYRDGLVTRADALEHADAPGELRFVLDRADFERGQTGATGRARWWLSRPDRRRRASNAARQRPARRCGLRRTASPD